MKTNFILFLVTLLASLSQVTNGVYFYAQKGKWRCFSDTVVKNNVSLPTNKLLPGQLSRLTVL